MMLKDAKSLKSPKCLMCDGVLEKSNLGNICNICKDKLRK